MIVRSDILPLALGGLVLALLTLGCGSADDVESAGARGATADAVTERSGQGVDRRAARLLVKAEELHRSGQSAQALSLTDRAARVDPDLPQTYSLRARILEAQGRREAALAAYDSVLVRDSTYEGVWQNRGNLLFRSGRFEEALASYRRSHRLNPRSDAVYLAGRTHARLGRIDSAAAAYDRALAMDSANAEAWRWKAVLEARRGRIGPAVRSARRAVDLQPENPHFQFVLGRYLLQDDRPEEALEHIRYARRAGHPDTVRVGRVLERARLRAGRTSEAPDQ